MTTPLRRAPEGPLGQFMRELGANPRAPDRSTVAYASVAAGAAANYAADPPFAR
jgi:hypothetical protein